jgi:hypothetical protein
MIERLITALQALAAPAEIQLSRFPNFVGNADGLALDYDDAFRLIVDCPQIVLTSEQRVALEEVDGYLDGMSGAANASLWTEQAIRSSAEWAIVRQLACVALVAIGAPVALSTPTVAVYIRAPCT